MDEKFSDKVFATADQAVGHGGEKVPILGHLIWYSVKESSIRTSDLKKLFTQVKIPMDFMPEEPSKINAFKRATTELSEETEVDIGGGKHAVTMVRLAAKTDEEIVKRRSRSNRLFHPWRRRRRMPSIQSLLYTSSRTDARICGSEACIACTHRRHCSSSPGKSRSA